MELNIADTFVSHDRSMVSHWALSADQMKNGFRTFLKTAVSVNAVTFDGHEDGPGRPGVSKRDLRHPTFRMRCFCL